MSYKETFAGLDLDTNWGSFNTYTNMEGTKALVVEWRTDRVLKKFVGETAHEDADRWAYDLHVTHDVYEWSGSSTLTRLA